MEDLYLSSKKITVVLPVYNNSGTLEKLVSKLEKYLKKKSSNKFEIIMIDDGSKDNSWNIISNLCTKKKYIKGIKLNRNYGQHSALLAGLREAKGDFVFTMDADLQDRVEDLDLFLKKMEADPRIDIILGVRKNYQPSFIKKLGSRLFFNLFRLFSKYQMENSSNFRLMRSTIVCEINNISPQSVQLSVTPYDLGAQIDYVYVQWDNPDEASRYTFFSSLKLALNNLFFFTKINIILPIYITIAVMIFLLGLIFYTIYIYFIIGTTVPGYYSILLIMTAGFLINFFLFISVIISIDNLNKQIGKVSVYNVQRRLNH